MKTRVALVLSGGGMFGAWQAGAWRALAPGVQPDLIVGASVGALNGYVIASGASPQELVELWRRPDFATLDRLPRTIKELMERYTPRTEYAAVLTDLFRLKPRIVSGSQITAHHLAASCAIPMLMPQRRVDGRWHSDGGLLNPLPVWAAVQLGATHIVALHALPESPSRWLEPLAKGFRRAFGYNPLLPPGVEVTMYKPERTLGTLRSALYWNRENIERWLEQGYADVLAASHAPVRD